MSVSNADSGAIVRTLRTELLEILLTVRAGFREKGIRDENLFATQYEGLGLTTLVRWPDGKTYKIVIMSTEELGVKDEKPSTT